MSERRPDDAADDSREILIETDESDDLEAAIREALEAVEKSGDASRGEGAGAAEAATEGGVEAAPEGGVEAAPAEEGELEVELSQAQDRLVRTLADFDNFRKRTEREQVERRRYEGFDLLREFLAIVDNLERALHAGGSVDDLKVGVELILKQIRDLFERSGVARVPTTGETFDPRVHEAMVRREGTDVSEPTVAEEFQAGYSMHDRLLRPARVAVDMPKEEPPPREPFD